MTAFPENAPGVTPQAAGVLLKPISLLPHGFRFQPHEFADQWLNQWGLVGDTRVQVTYQEVETVDSAAQRKTSSVPLRDAVTRGFLIAHQSRATAEPSPREGWVYPHRSHMSLDFSSLRVNGKGLSPDVLQQLHTGIASGYQGIGQPVITEVDAQGNLLSPREKEQVRQLGHLDVNQVKLARLFAALPTFDTVLKRLLVSRIKAKIPERKFHTSLLQGIDPDHWYVNQFSVDSFGGRSLTASQCFTDVMLGCLATDTPPTYSRGGVGFYTRPDSVEEVDSVFVSPLDAKIPALMESVFYIAEPATNDSLKQQFRDDLSAFRHDRNGADALDTSTTEAALAHLLSRRFLHLFDLYKVDRDPATPLTQSARTLQDEEDRLLDLITTHPSMEDRSRLQRAPIPHVYVVMLDMGAAKPQKWPAAMVIKRTDQPSLFLYSLEGGIQRFRSFQDLVNHVSPTYAGQKCGIRDIASELPGSVFAVAADDLLQQQRAALETVLNASGNQTLPLAAYALKVEDALGLPVLSLAGPLAVRREILVENNRADFYATATRAEKSNYRSLETQVLEAAYTLTGSDIPTLSQFTRQKIKQYLQHAVYPGVDPDPDKTLVTLSYGKGANPRQSRIVSLTELMLDNLRPAQYPNAMREVLAVYLVDQDGQRIRHPADGFPITLTGRELARMATHIDAGGRYETLLRKDMNKPDYKAAWQAAYLANMKFKGYEAGLRGDEVFKTTVFDRAFHPPKPKKLIALWQQAVLQSPVAETRALVQGRRVQVYALVLGGSVGAGEQHGTMGNAISIDGVLVFSDQDGPDFKGTVGVYFPDSPEGNDYHEFSSLGEGVAGLLQQEQWQGYFRSRICTLDPEEIKRTLGQQRGRPLIRGALIPGNLLEALHRAHVNFHSAYADHRSNSNRDVHRQTSARLVMMAMETFMDLAGILLVPGFQLLKSAIKTGWLMVRTGAVPANLATLAFVHRVANYGGRGVAGGVSVPVRGQSSFLALTARQSQGETLAGLPLEDALYRRYAVTDTSLLQGLAADAQGFYRPTVNNSVTRAVYVRQPDGTVFRVHDHTKLTATEATLVDPATGLSIRSSGVMRSTVARMPNGEWRAVGFGQGGGKRPAGSSPQPGPSKPKVPALSLRASEWVRTAGHWDNDIMDLVPSVMTRLPSWPQNRSLLIMDEITAGRSWSVRFTPGQDERFYRMSQHPDRSSTDIVLRRTAENHYSLILGRRVVEIPADGDCFFNAVARGLNEGQAQEAFTMQGLRNATADYIVGHPQISRFVMQPATGLQLALSDIAPWLQELLEEAALSDLTRIVYNAPNPHRLFQPVLDHLDRHANSLGRRTLDAARDGILPPELLQEIGHYLSVRSPERLMPSSAPFYTQETQSLRRFFEDVLLGPIDDLHLTELLNNEHLQLSQDVIHIMLEYGVRARQLTDHHPRNELAYVKYNETLHGHLDDDQLDDLLEGADLVDQADLNEVKQRYQRESGVTINDDAKLMNQFMYYDQVEDTIDLLSVALGRFPDLQRRANLLLRSTVISSNLGGMLPVNVLARWLRDPKLSEARLGIIAEYANTRYTEVIDDGTISIDWMQPFDDQNLNSIIRQQDSLTRFVEFLGWVQSEAETPAVVGLFSVSGQAVSNTRVSILLSTPNIFNLIQRFPRDHAIQIWEDLVGPYFSDAAVRAALRQPGSLRSELDIARALRVGLGVDGRRANQIVRDSLGVGQRQAQQYLYNFEFPANRLGHRLLDFALYLESHMAVPDWAWRYLRQGVTRETLKPFGAKKKP
ncbi:dermonecrotic toxin domain-containing protein [Pseudomonas sp. RL_105y_Pfl2_101]|uniref:dermonecrotic toxin domain-containing protein n=1 Tax=Pseudomonas sp. RL_105y_Pfl2_101 TaxID=3088708 RepID=UPI0030DA4D29